MPPKPAIPQPASKVILLRISLPPSGIFLDELLLLVASESIDETIPPADPLVVVVLAEVAVVLELPERVMLSVSPAAPVGIGCPICEVKYQ
jgi:hypothetical protein